MLKHCGHYWHERPDEFFSQVRAFLGLPPSSWGRVYPNINLACNWAISKWLQSEVDFKPLYHPCHITSFCFPRWLRRHLGLFSTSRYWMISPDTKSLSLVDRKTPDATWASGERCVRIAEVGGSSPPISTIQDSSQTPLWEEATDTGSATATSVLSKTCHISVSRLASPVKPLLTSQVPAFQRRIARWIHGLWWRISR